MENASKAAQHTFHNLVLAGKGGLVFLLLVLSLVNGNKDFVTQNPRSFIGSAVLCAFIGALAGGLLAWDRKGDVGNAVFIGTLFFFFFQVCREFSGYYKLMSGEDMTQNQSKERKPLIITGVVIGVAFLIAAVYLAYKAGVKPTDIRGIFGTSGTSAFVIETIVFLILCVGAEVGVGVLHGDKSPGSIVSSLVMYLIAHLCLQYGGFYDHVFAPMNWNKLN